MRWKRSNAPDSLSLRASGRRRGDLQHRAWIDDREALFAQVVLVPEAVVAAGNRPLVGVELQVVGAGLGKRLGRRQGQADRAACPPRRRRSLSERRAIVRTDLRGGGAPNGRNRARRKAGARR